MSGDVFGCHGLEGRGATGISWLEPRDTAKCPTIMYRIAPHNDELSGPKYQCSTKAEKS